jgi:hypothetical protein
MLGQALVRKDRLVGEVGDAVQPVDRGHGRAAAGGDDETPGADAMAVGLNLVARDEPRTRLDHLDAQALETLDAIVWCYAGDHLVDVTLDRRHVDLGRDGANTERRRCTHPMGRPCCRDQALRRHAADVQAITAHPRRLDQDGRRAELCGARRDRKAGRAGADDADVRLDQLAHRSRFRNRPDP